MDTKTEVGRVNVSFEMESKQEDHAETCGEEDTPQARPKVETQLYKDSDTVKHHPLFLIVSAIAVASLLTALATLVLANLILLKITLRHINTQDNIYQAKELSKCRKASLKVIKLSCYFLAIGRIVLDNFLSFKS